MKIIFLLSRPRADKVMLIPQCPNWKHKISSKKKQKNVIEFSG